MTTPESRRPVLVTGANGFVGARLVARLCDDGARVRAFVRPTANLDRLANLSAQVTYGDVTDPVSLGPALEGVRIVFHLAGTLAGLTEQDFIRVNVEGTRHLVEACAAHANTLERLVVVSSLAAAGPSPTSESPVTEETPERPISWYGRSKLEADRIVQRQTGVQWTILRPGIVYGPGDWALLGIVRLMTFGIAPVLAGAERKYSMMFVDDLVDALLSAATSTEAARQLFLVTGGEPVGLKELADHVGEAVGRRVRTVPIPLSIASAAGTIVDLLARATNRPQIFGSQKVNEMFQPGWIARTEKVTRVLGWSASTSLEDGLRQTIAWWRQEGWL